MDPTFYPHDIPGASFALPTAKKTRTCNDIPNHALNLNLELRKSACIQDYLKAACAKSIFTHILFSRGVIPAPAEQVLNILKDIQQERHNKINGDAPALRSGAKRKRSDTVRERKYEKHGGQIISVLNALDVLFGLETAEDRKSEGSSKSTSCSGCKAILITIGPSFSSPREQYLIRFYSWKGSASDTNIDENSNLNDVPPKVQQRLSQEMGRRSVRELICGALQEEYSAMFDIKSVGMDSMKVNIACLLTKDGLSHLFETNHNIDRDQIQNHFLINRRLEVKEPRMYSKSRSLHRPFSVLNVIPLLRSSQCTSKCDDQKQCMPQFEHEDGDCWVALRSFVKAFRA